MPIITVKSGRVISIEEDGEYIGALIEYYDENMNILESCSVSKDHLTISNKYVGETGSEAEHERLDGRIG